jgi:hypothetical protein
MRNTAQGFKALKLGKIAGNETYRWIIFTSGISSDDLRSDAAWGCYSLDGKVSRKLGTTRYPVVNSFTDG